MAIEIPKHCANCPRMTALKTAAELYEMQEDELIQQYMQTDELEKAVDTKIIVVLQNPTDGTQEVADLPRMARAVLDEELDAVKTNRDRIKEIIALGSKSCAGSVNLRGAQDGVSYEVTLCRSEESFDDIENPLNEGREGALYEIALVKRDQTEQQQ